MTYDYEPDFGGWNDVPAPEPNPEPAGDWSFDIADNVGSREVNDRQDVIKVETLLGNSDYLDLKETDGPTGYWGSRTEEAVREYQKDKGLTVDGWLAPGGETITTMKDDLGDFLSRSKPATPDEVDDHHDRLTRGEDGTLRLRRHDFALKPRDDLPELSAESEASNHRLAQAIHRTSDFGQIPTYMADAVKTDGDSAIAEAHDLMKRLGPERGQELAQAVVEKLPPEHRPTFIGGPVSERQPLGVGYHMLHKPTEEDIKKNPELGGGLGGEIAGMKKDAEEAEKAAKNNAEAPEPTAPPAASPEADRHEKVPAWKRGVFADQPGVWEAHGEAVKKLPDITPSGAYALREIFAAEGGMKPDKGQMRDGVPEEKQTFGGITPTVLREAKEAKVPGLDNVAMPRELNVEQNAAVSRWYLDRGLSKVGGIKALDDLGNDRAAAAIADTLYRHGVTGGTRLIQGAINKVEEDKVATDGRMRPETFNGFKEMVADPEKRAKLSKELEKLRNTKTENYETDRMAHFTFD